VFELRLLAPEDRVEIVGDALDALDALSVSVEDADAQTDAEQALFGEPGMPPPKEGWQRSRVIALFATQELARNAAAVLPAQDFFAGCGVIGVVEVPEQDWVRLTQSQFAPVEITPEFWIVPSWHEPPAQARHVIRLDPGLAFGTGTHPTTRMCLRWTASHGDLSDQRVLDYGCGSGILAIGAAKFGARDIDAVDIDAAAIESTRRNAEANGVRLNAGLPETASGRYDIVLANILATPLKVLAPLLCGHVAPGGSLVLAGILDRQADELKQAYAPHVSLKVADSEEGWVLLVGTVPSAHEAQPLPMQWLDPEMLSLGGEECVTPQSPATSPAGDPFPNIDLSPMAAAPPPAPSSPPPPPPLPPASSVPAVPVLLAVSEPDASPAPPVPPGNAGKGLRWRVVAAVLAALVILGIVLLLSGWLPGSAT
jgi:ribosomal protein L11 methyltransferase